MIETDDRALLYLISVGVLVLVSSLGAWLAKRRMKRKLEEGLGHDRSCRYGNVIKIIDVVKGTGANPIILQPDDLP